MLRSRGTERSRASRGKGAPYALALAAGVTALLAPRSFAEPTATPGPTGTPCPPLLSENFDGVTAPNLPPGWMTTASGAEGPWTTSHLHPWSEPNDAFAPAVSSVGNTELISPVVAIPPGGGVVGFRNLFNMQEAQNLTTGFDGTVLEISIDGGPFVDIIAAGGSFNLGGYNRTISTNTMSPIAGRMAWSGLSGGTLMAPASIITVATLPAAAGGHNIQLKWRTATDQSIIVSGVGVCIDDVLILGADCDVPTPTPTPAFSCAPVITQSTSQTITPGSFACNTGFPNYTNLGNSYWRAFDMASVTGGEAFYVTSVSFGIERAVSQSIQFVNVRLYRQTSGVFPGGTRTQIGYTFLDLVPELKGVIAGAPLDATVPAGTTQLIMEVETPATGNSIFIGSNAAPQTGPSYISSPAFPCGLTTPTDLGTHGYPDMHIVMNVRGYWFCPGGSTPTPPPTPTPSPTAAPTPVCGTFTAPVPINIPGSGIAAPYPSNTTVSGVGGAITKVTVALNGLSLHQPNDIDVLLVGPGGQSAIIMSDAGCFFNVNGVNLVLDDGAPSFLPFAPLVGGCVGGPFQSGTFRPTNIQECYDNSGGTDTFPAPAPVPSGAVPLSVFNGTNPNGTWSLYVVDDGGVGGTGAAFTGGWSISIATTNCVGPTPFPPPSPTPGGATHFSVVAPGMGIAGTPFNFTVTALDEFNNLDTDYRGTVHFTDSDPFTSGLPPDATLTNGTGVFSANLFEGVWTITATDVDRPSITGTSNCISVQKPQTPAPPTPTPGHPCPPTITHSSSQTITPGSFSCNSGPPNFVNLGNKYWRAFDMTTFTGGQTYNVTSVSFGIERAVSQSIQIVDVRLYRQTSGVFPGGTRTEIGFATLDLAPELKGIIAGAPMDATVPAGTTELIMEVSTSTAGSGNSSFFIGANEAPQTGLSYISAPACNLTNPTDLATIGFPDMHLVMNVHGSCPGGIVTPTPTPTPTATATVTPTPTPGGVTHAVNLSTRLLVGTGNDVGIGGFIITGTSSKQVLLRGIGPSLGGFGVPNPLADPFLELRDVTGALIASNDNWCTPPNDICDLIIATGIPPMNPLESAILITLDPGAYTAILKGVNNGTGVGLVEIYDLNQGAASKLANISTRGFVGAGNEIMIAGILLGGGSGSPLVMRGIGPSLTTFGVPNALADPTLELRDSSGTLLVANDNWQDAPFCKLVCAFGLGPSNTLESAVEATLPPGAYTTLLAGVDGGTGVGLVEVYDLGLPAPTPTPEPTPPTKLTPTPSPTPSGTPIIPPPTPTPVTCIENFDGVIAPALPPGWVASNPIPGDGVSWTTSTVNPDSAPNDAFIPNQDGISDKVLDWTGITVNSATARLTFWNNYDTEFSDGVFCDGGVLEISTPSISNGDFLDFTDSRVGAKCLTGCYTEQRNCGGPPGPIAEGGIWAGTSNGYINTAIDLGPNLKGQTVTLRWRFRTDEAVVAPGWRIDSVYVSEAFCP